MFGFYFLAALSRSFVSPFNSLIVRQSGGRREMWRRSDGELHFVNSAIFAVEEKRHFDIDCTIKLYVVLCVLVFCVWQKFVYGKIDKRKLQS